MKEHIFNLIEKIKEAFKAFWNWGKDSYFKWVLKGFVIVLMAIAAILIIRELIFPLTIAALVIYSIADSSAGKRNLQNIQMQNAVNAWYEDAGHVICNTLIENAKILQIISPKVVSDIMPRNSHGITSQDGNYFFHYIVRCENFDDNKLMQSRELFNELIAQEKSNIFPMDNSMFYTMRIARDVSHHDAIHLTVFHVDTDAKWNYVQQYENYIKNRTRQSSSGLTDEEF